MPVSAAASPTSSPLPLARPQGLAPSAPGDVSTPPPAETGPAETAAPESAATARRSGRWPYILGVLIFLAYAFWMMGPYLHSVIVRDAAVTSWSNIATSPIAGDVESKPLAADRVVGADGVILLVRNDRLSRQALTEAQIRLDLARYRVTELQNFLEDVMALDEERGDLKARYADTFRAQLDAEIASLESKIGVATGRMGVMQKITARSEELARRGTGSETTADEARIRVADLDLTIAELRADLDYAHVRRQAADHSVFITRDGEDPEWVRGGRQELKLEKKQARLELRGAQAELELAKASLAQAQDDLRRLSEGAVRAPPGSLVWSQVAAPGAATRAGDPVAEWLDCSILLIDVPVSDAEVSLIRPGTEAEVVLEGEAVARTARVLLARGSASPLGRNDLVALAKGRREGGAQVLLELPHEPGDFQLCPVGRAAYVDFPDVGLIDVIRARLRL